MVVLGLIPARGGSKTVPRKNIRLVGGRPLITYAIEAARHSRMLTHVVTSTDDREIAAVAEHAGSQVIDRPAGLAQDDTPMIDVVRHALGAFEARAGRADYLVVLQPTAPLRTAEDIDAAMTLLKATGADSVVSVCPVGDTHPARMYRLTNDRLVPYRVVPPNRLRQALETLYHRNGAVYACRRELVETGTLIGPDTRPLLMPRSRSLNIDEETDLAFAEFLLSRQPTGETA